jgi:hypothetical protein
MKLASRILAVLSTLLLAASMSFAATSVASVKGIYNFEIGGVTTNAKGQAVQQTNYGTVSFDGKGHVTFLSITSVNGGKGGPVKGSVWPYAVSGFNGALGTAQDGAYFTLGSFNAAGIATVLTLRTADTVPKPGVATLQ